MVVTILIVLGLAACTSTPALPAGLVNRKYVEHLTRYPGTDQVKAKLVATEGVPTDPTGLRLCDWPNGCQRPFAFVWLREEVGHYLGESPLGSNRPMLWIVTTVDARSGVVITTGRVLGPNSTGWPNFNRAHDLATGTNLG